ncbi:MAG: hypothetical protein ACR2NC_00010 [Thermodesulfobacteriota bacterium]
MTYIIVILLISIVISLYVIMPLVRGFYIKDPEKNILDSLEDLNVNNYDDLINKRDLIINEIRDIEFDFGLGKLNTRDYNEIKDKYRYRAAEIYKKIDDIQDINIDSSRSEIVEKEIREVKKSIQSSN